MSVLRPVHERFEEQAAKYPDAVAVVAGPARLTYAELNARACALAHELLHLGCGPETVVGVCMNRDVEFLVAILAVWKAGAAWLPLDPSQPADLRDFMLANSGASVVLTQSAAGEVGSRELGVGGRRFKIASSPTCDSRHPTPNPGSRESGVGSRRPKVVGSPTPNPQPPTPGPLAYVIYTSGSTGRPKGVAIEHRSLANYAASIIEDLDLQEQSTFAFVSTIGADLGHTVLFPALCTGGTVHILSEDVATDGRAFAQYLAAHPIDYLKIVPSHLVALIVDDDPRAILPRKGLILGGEASSTQWVQRLQAAAPQCRIYNHYGPTETTVGVLTYRFDPGQPPVTSTLPLRTPLANSELYLLDPHMRSVRRGAVGELYIGGACVGRGYINDPERTAERFVPHPSSGTRLYKSGDRARQLANGDLELLGRSDRQINLRGYRIEPGQVESVLREHAGVRQCVVALDAEGTQLVAYVGGNANGDELREHAGRGLPRYMVPGSFVVVDQLPLTANGKIDFVALRALRSDALAESGGERPRDSVEMRLSALWAEMLGVPVGLRDDFFQLGGHSLLAVRLAGRIYDEFRQRIPLAAFFTNRTIEQLAILLRESTAAQRQIAIPIQPKGALPPFFCFPGAGGSVLYFHDLARALAPDQPVWGLQALGLDDDSPIPGSIEEIASRYIDTIRGEIQPHGPYHFAGHSFGALVAFEMTRQLQALGEEVAFLGILDNAAPAAASERHYALWGDQDWLLHIAIRIGKLYGRDLAFREEELSGKSYDGQIDTLIDRLLARRLLPAGLNKTYFRRFVEIYKANAMAAVAYRPETAPLPVRLTLFRAAEEDPDLHNPTVAGDPALGWNRYAVIVDIVGVPGTHITMLTEPHAQELAAKMRVLNAGDSPAGQATMA